MQVRHAPVLIIVIAHKNTIEDIRDTPVFKLIELLEKKGAKTEFYDSQVHWIPITRELPNLAGRPSIK